MHRYLVIFWIFLLLPASASVVSAKQHFKLIDTQKTHVGEIVFFKLPGNPSAGFKWRLNERLSTGLNLVEVDLIGWLLAEQGKSLFFGKQSVMNVAIRSKAAGQADLAFDYHRYIGGHSFTKTSIIRIFIKPRLAAQ